MERKGIITSRTCPRCGHHEIGFTTRDGVFHPLKPGTLIELIGPSEETGLPESQVAGQGFSWPGDPLQGLTFSGITEGPFEHGDTPRGFDEGGEDFSHYNIWFPDPLGGDQLFRLKYGVMVGQGLGKKEMTPDAYHKAYLRKLEWLIEKEIQVPVAVLLDRFFTSPHLASGTPKQIAEAMWEELEEVRAPALLVSAWLEKPNDDTLRDLIHPASRDELKDFSVDRAEAVREMEALTLEGFLGMM